MSKPGIAVRHARLSAPQRVALLQQGPDIAPIDPVVVPTWNVNQKVLPKSAQAPGDDRVWSAANNFEAVQADVPRLQPDVVSLQECAGAVAATRLAEKYDLLARAPLREDGGGCDCAERARLARRCLHRGAPTHEGGCVALHRVAGRAKTNRSRKLRIAALNT